MQKKIIPCYQWSNEDTLNADDALHFTLSNIESNGYFEGPIEEKLQQSMCRFSLQKNNCRHMAIAIICHILGVPTLPGNISSTYLDNLPFQARFEAGKPVDNVFCVFPLLPPNCARNAAILKKIYQSFNLFGKTEMQLLALINLYMRIESFDMNASTEHVTLVDEIRAWQTEYNAIFYEKPSETSYIVRWFALFTSAPTLHQVIDDIIQTLHAVQNSTSEP